MIPHHTADGSNASRNADPSHQSMSQSHWRQWTSKLIKAKVVYVFLFIFQPWFCKAWALQHQGWWRWQWSQKFVLPRCWGAWHYLCCRNWKKLTILSPWYCRVWVLPSSLPRAQAQGRKIWQQPSPWIFFTNLLRKLFWRLHLLNSDSLGSCGWLSPLMLMYHH